MSAGLDFGDLGKLDLFNVDIGPWDLEQNILNLTSDDLSTQVPLPDGFSLTFAWPNLDTTSGALVDDTASSSGASNNFLELGLDVDELVFTLLELPNPFDIGFDVGIPDVASASFHAELADLDLFFGMNFLQQFAMAVTDLTGTITFEDGSSQPFDFDTDIELTNASSHDTDHDGSIDYDLLLTPSATLANNTDLGFNFGVQFDVLKLSGSYELLGVGELFQPRAGLFGRRHGPARLRGHLRQYLRPQLRVAGFHARGLKGRNGTGEGFGTFPRRGYTDCPAAPVAGDLRGPPRSPPHGTAET